LDTITGDDYTIELKIDRKDYDLWHAEDYDKDGRNAPAIAFKKVIARKCEDLLANYSEKFVKNDPESGDDEKIAE
jgi:hypothetical protein